MSNKRKKKCNKVMILSDIAKELIQGGIHKVKYTQSNKPNI